MPKGVATAVTVKGTTSSNPSRLSTVFTTAPRTRSPFQNTDEQVSYLMQLALSN
jgi:hypothetical protein